MNSNIKLGEWVYHQRTKECSTCGVLVSEVLCSSSSCRCRFILSACSSWRWSCRNCSRGTVGQACCWGSCRSQVGGGGLRITGALRCCIWRTRAKPGQLAGPPSQSCLESVKQEQWSHEFTNGLADPLTAENRTAREPEWEGSGESHFAYEIIYLVNKAGLLKSFRQTVRPHSWVTKRPWGTRWI